jgi:DNA-binding MarR family transcriptional regulator
MPARLLTAADIGAACICLGVRKAARRLARRYDEAFRPLGITSGQFSILAALSGRDVVPLGRLADALGMDRTTLNRNLRPMELEKLIVTSSLKTDARVRGVALTERGRTLLQRALPLWQQAQTDSLKRLGPSTWPSLRAQLAALE